MALDDEIRLNKAIDEISRRAEECKKHGHKKPSNEPYTWDSINGLRARGYCTHCNSYYDRQLTQKERRHFEKFREFLYEPMI